jgi:hypothetical protein
VDIGVDRDFPVLPNGNDSSPVDVARPNVYFTGISAIVASEEGSSKVICISTTGITQEITLFLNII